MIELKKIPKTDLVIELIKDPDRKSLFKIIAEVFYLFCIQGYFPRHYFSRYLFKKEITNIKDYLPGQLLQDKIRPSFNNKEVTEVLENKLFFDLFYSQFNISMPKILMYNHRKMFVIGKKSIEVNSVQDFITQLKEIFKQNPAYDSLIIKKTYNTSGGDQVYKLFLHQLTTDPELINKLYCEVIAEAFVFQETIKQHPDIDKLNPSCINTIRIDTFIDSHGKIDIISAFIRISINNLYVDNISSGGCMIGIDLKTGKLKKIGHSSIQTYGVKVLTKNPITETVFENFSIPFFPQAKELVLRTASFMPELRLIGWDVAIGESGPIIVEGNSDYGVAANDLASGGYGANPIFRKVLDEYYHSKKS